MEDKRCVYPDCGHSMWDPGMRSETENRYLFDSRFHNLVDSIVHSDFSNEDIHDAVELALYLREELAKKAGYVCFRVNNLSGA